MRKNGIETLAKFNGSRNPRFGLNGHKRVLKTLRSINRHRTCLETLVYVLGMFVCSLHACKLNRSIVDQALTNG